jgi:O-antigen/teichoic acid export membrane protein
MVVGFAFWPELSRSFGARDLALARRLHRQAFQAAAGLSLVCGFLLWLAGPSIYGAWLHSSVSFDAPCFHGLLFVTAANSLWYISSIVPASANAHQRLALCNLVTSATCLGLAASIVRLTGIKGAAMALLVQDATMCWFVLTWALRQVKDTPRTFFAGLCDFSSYTSLPRQLVDGRRVTY